MTRLGWVVMAAAVTAGCGNSTPVAPSRQSSSWLAYSRPADAFVGAESGLYSGDNATFDAVLREDASGIYLQATVIPNGKPRCQLFLAAPRGKALAAGTYSDATRWPFQNPQAPGLDFSCGNGCNISDGSFVIRELSPTVVGPVQRLDVIFEQTCHRFGTQGDERMATLNGQLRFIRNP